MANIKNQLKSYTSEVTKKDLLNYFVFLGGVTTSSNIVDETDISFVSKITKDEVSVVVQKNVWSMNETYEPYFIDSSGVKTYVLNEENSIVYLCVGKNQPSGLIGDQEYKSTIPPSHINGIQTLSDGYSWLALYAITDNLNKFVNQNSIPVNNLYEYRYDIVSGTYTTKYTNTCKSTPNNLGKCYFYYTIDEFDPIQSVNVSKGTQVLGIPEDDWYCSVCHEVGEKLGYKSYHLSNDNKQSEIDRDGLEIIKSFTDNRIINVNDTNYIHQKNYEYILSLNHAINTLHLDISNLTVEERIVSTQNPSIEVLDARGIGAIAKITTYYDIIRNAFIANGIELQNGGSDYVNPSFRVFGAANTKLNSAIKAVLIDPVFIPDPSVILPTPRVSVVKQITNEDLSDLIGTKQTSFFKTGILSEIQDTNGVNIATGTIPGQKKDLRATSLLTLAPSGISGGISVVPNVGISEIILQDETATSGKVVIVNSTVATQSDYSSKVVAGKLETTGNYSLEIAGADELTFDVLNNASIIEIDSINYTINNVDTPLIRIDNAEFVAVKTLNIPINIVDKDTRLNAFTINFII